MKPIRITLWSNRHRVNFLPNFGKTVTHKSPKLLLIFSAAYRKLNRNYAFIPQQDLEVACETSAGH